MGKEKVTIFQYYPFAVGQRIRIEGGPREGDWEVTSVSERKVGLRCPVTGRQVEWDRFVYFVEEDEAAEWPRREKV